MPFVVRTVEPRRVGRARLHDSNGRPIIKDGELEAVSNATLANALRQLASVARIAQQIFDQLNAELCQVTERSSKLKRRIGTVGEKVSAFDPKAVTVPESDLTEFWSRKNHFKSCKELSCCLFTEASRPEPVQALYDAAGTRSVSRVSADRLVSVSPVLGRRKANLPLDIETRKPAVLRKLRRWTSTEALGRVTVEPDASLRLDPTPDSADHTLPSPEEQLQAIALKFPAEIVTVDVTGKSFQRMSNLRRSMVNSEYDDTVRRRTKPKKPRGKRRNTIAGTDTKELAAIVGESSDTNMGKSTPENPPLGAEKKSHLENLKEWGRSRLRQIRNIESGVRLRSISNSRRKWDKEEPNPHSSSGNWSASSESGHSTATSHIPRSSASSGSMCTKNKKFPIVSTSSSVTSESTLTPDEGETSSMYSCDTEGYYTSFHLDSGLKTLREEEPCTPLHSSSALSVNSQINQSGESEYELFGKGSTSTTASSAGTVCTTLVVPPAPSVPERVSSQLSGNKTLPERTTRSNEIEKRETQSLKLAKNTDMKMLTFDEIKKINESKSNLTKENVTKHEKEPSDNQNCIITVDVHHEHRGNTPEKCGDSPDSGHNTCSSPVDSVASPSLDLEMSECSDLEGVDRMERIRVKTTINSSRIPSMCVITPPQSDDEVSLTHSYKAVDSGEYVTIAEIRGTSSPKTPTSPILLRETEFVSLNELPKSENLSEPKRQGARVTLNAEGRVVYSSDSLRRRKSIHTTGTFEPGPCVNRSENSPVPQRQAIIKSIDTLSPLFANRKVITPAPIHKSQPKSGSNTENKDILIQNNLRQPLASVNRTLSPPSQRRDNISNQKQYFTKATFEKTPTTPNSRPLSPLVSPTNQKSLPRSSPATSPIRAASPRMIVKAKTGTRPLSPTQSRGAYVRVNQPSPPDDSKFAVKRSESYRIANEETVFNPNSLGRKQYGPGVVAGPSLISAIHAARTGKAPDDQKELMNSFDDSFGNGGQSTWPRSTSTPTKASDSMPLNFSTATSPITKSVSPTKNSRSAMDLYAIIHESKKRIQNLQKVPAEAVNWPKAIPAKSVPSIQASLDSNIPQPMPPLKNINQQRYVKQSNIGYNSLPRLQVQTLEESPRNLQRKVYERQRNPELARRLHEERSSLASDRHGPTQPTSRNDFKRLLLQTAWSTTPTRGSAVERLRNKGLPPHMKPVSHDVLSSTIPEDCDDEEEQTHVDSDKHNLKSSTLVNDINKKFQSKSHTTLETAL